MPDLSDSTAYKGAIILRGNLALPKLWQRLHDNAHQWGIMLDMPDQKKNLVALDSIDLDLLGRLAECPAEAWKLICFGAGATVMGAVGLSWCKGAVLADVWHVWAMTGLALLSHPIARRPARLLNPALVGETTSLHAILADAPNDPFLACVQAARAWSAISIDIDETAFAHVPVPVASFVCDAAKGRQMTGPRDQAFAACWSDWQDSPAAPAPVQASGGH
jgi:hypothetical protein